MDGIRLVATGCVAAGVAAVFVLLESTIAGAVFATMPYIVLIWAARATAARPYFILLAALLASSALGLTLASTSSTGGIAFAWIVPCQIVACCLLRAQASERAGRPASSG